MTYRSVSKFEGAPMPRAGHGAIAHLPLVQGSPPVRTAVGKRPHLATLAHDHHLDACHRYGPRVTLGEFPFLQHVFHPCGGASNAV